MAVSTSADIAGFFSSLFEEAMFVFRAQALMPSLVTLFTGSGMAPRVQGIFPTLTAATAVEGDTISDSQTWNKSAKMSITPQIRHAQVIITQSMIDTDNDATMDSASTEMGRALAQAVDTDLLSNFANFSTALGAAGSAMTIKIEAAAVSRLQNAKIPMPIQAVYHPYHWFDLWVELGQPAATYQFLGDVANEALKQFAVSNFNGMVHYISPNISVDSLDDAISGVFHRDALALDTRQAPKLNVTEHPEVAGYGYQLDLEMWYAHGERRDEAGVKITADATAPTGA